MFGLKISNEENGVIDVTLSQLTLSNILKIDTPKEQETKECPTKKLSRIYFRKQGQNEQNWIQWSNLVLNLVLFQSSQNNWNICT